MGQIGSSDDTYNRYGEELENDAAEAVNVINSTKNLRNFSCVDCGLGKNGLTNIVNAIIANKLPFRSFFFWGSEFGDDGAKVIADFLKVNSTLSILNVGKCKLTAVGAKYIIDALITSNNCALNNLNLSRNAIGDEGAKDIARLVVVKSTLLKLDITWDSGITTVGFHDIIDALLRNSTLQRLAISTTAFNDVIIKNIVTIIGSNSSLRELDITQYEVGPDVKCFKNNWGFFKYDESIFADLYFAVLSSPNFSMDTFNITLERCTPNGSYKIGLVEKIFAVYNSNKLMNKALIDGEQTEYYAADLSSINHIRCYDVSFDYLESLFEQHSKENNWPLVTSIFIYRSEMTDGFIKKWFLIMGSHIFKSVETLVLIQCELGPIVQFLSCFPRLKHLNLSHNKINEILL
jgi:hypothetical protein